MAKHTIVLIPGDGIGPEVTNATKRVLSAAGLSVDWVELPAGAAAVEQGFDGVLPERGLPASGHDDRAVSEARSPGHLVAVGAPLPAVPDRRR